ncbi:MAG: response regulator [Bacteroidetes bacterium]|nr:response regulator [Bacteroidota bacterium]
MRSNPLIVISDTESPFCESYIGALSHGGYRVVTIPDKCELFNSLSSMKPDLIITSIRSDSIDGLEFLESVKTSFRLRKIPVIIATAHSELKADAARLGASKFLVKPFASEELEQAIRSELAYSPWTEEDA